MTRPTAPYAGGLFTWIVIIKTPECCRQRATPTKHWTNFTSVQQWQPPNSYWRHVIHFSFLILATVSPFLHFQDGDQTHGLPESLPALHQTMENLPQWQVEIGLPRWQHCNGTKSHFHTILFRRETVQLSHPLVSNDVEVSNQNSQTRTWEVLFIIFKSQ